MQDVKATLIEDVLKVESDVSRELKNSVRALIDRDSAANDATRSSCAEIIYQQIMGNDIHVIKAEAVPDGYLVFYTED